GGFERRVGHVARGVHFDFHTNLDLALDSAASARRNLRHHSPHHAALVVSVRRFSGGLWGFGRRPLRRLRRFHFHRRAWCFRSRNQKDRKRNQRRQPQPVGPFRRFLPLFRSRWHLSCRRPRPCRFHPRW